jgi:hypothetical protein
VPLVPGGVGSSRAEIEQTFGPQESSNDAGEAIYQDGSVRVAYNANDQALRIVFDLSGSDLAGFDRDQALMLAAYYRPPDAQFVATDPAADGVERTHYTSSSLAAAFTGQDLGGRDPSAYVEELHFDPATDHPLAIVMAVGQQP